jgi:hypothetical protein
MPPGVVAGGDLISCVQKEWMGNAELLPELTHGGGGLPDAHPHDRKALGTELPVERLLGGQLPPALRSPGGKECEEDDLSPQVGKAHALPVGVRKGEVRWFGAAFGQDNAHGGKWVRGSSCQTGDREKQDRDS